MGWWLFFVACAVLAWYVAAQMRSPKMKAPRVPLVHMRHLMKDVDGVQAVWLSPETELEVVGESFYADHLEGLAEAGLAGAGPTLVAWLSPEPDNPHDSNAVAVKINGGQVGHLSRDNAKKWQPALIALMADRGAPIACAAEVRGSTRLGVFLRVPHDAPSHW